MPNLWFMSRWGGQRLREGWIRRELGQLSLADGLVDGGAGRNWQLERIAALVDRAAFARLLGDGYAAPVGRPSYGPVVLLMCLLLQQSPVRPGLGGPRRSAHRRADHPHGHCGRRGVA